MMLKEMRKTRFDDNKYFNSYETEFWRTLLDQQVAINLSEKEPLGIAGQVRQQLDPTAMYRSMHHFISQGAPSSVRRNFLPSVPLQPFSDRQAFIKSMLPHAQKAAQALGVDPRVLIAQAALETGWGKHFAAPYNLFGIKADQRWHGPRSTQETVEFTGAMPWWSRLIFAHIALLKKVSWTMLVFYVKILDTKRPWQTLPITTHL